MAGTLNDNLRGGTQSEYLAQYLLSALGLVVPVPYQEDEGKDFYCSVAKQEGGNLTFDYPYIIQIKSTPQNDSDTFLVSYGELNKKKEWKKYEKDWLFNQQLPLFIGIVDKRKTTLRIYSSSTIWFLYHDKPNCSKIHLSCRLIDSSNNIGVPECLALADWPENSGDGFEYFVDLGNPVAILDVNTIWEKENDEYKNIKNRLRATIYIEQNNIVYRRLGIPYFNWLLDIKKDFVGINYPYSQGGNLLSEHFSNILFAAAIAFRSSNENEKLKHIRELIRLLPREHFQEINDATSQTLKEAIEFLFD